MSATEEASLMARLRSHAAIAALTVLLIASSQGCGADESKDGPPFEPGNLDGPKSLLVTNGDIDGVGASTPYGAVLGWWQALQLGDVKRVQRSYARPISSREARREIDGFQPRFSQPIEPEVRTRGSFAKVETQVRTASPFEKAPNVISVRDAQTAFYLVRLEAGWKLRIDSYERYTRSRQRSRLAVG